MGVVRDGARLFAVMPGVLAVQSGAHAQAPAVTAADYARAGRRVGLQRQPAGRPRGDATARMSADADAIQYLMPPPKD